jgi:hypothetical protein
MMDAVAIHSQANNIFTFSRVLPNFSALRILLIYSTEKCIS